MKSCAECGAFSSLTYNPDGPEPIGVCRRHAPHGALLGHVRATPLGDRFIWPIVFADAWCYDFIVEIKDVPEVRKNPNDKSYMHRQGDGNPRLGDDDA